MTSEWHTSYLVPVTVTVSVVPITQREWFKVHRYKAVPNYCCERLTTLVQCYENVGSMHLISGSRACSLIESLREAKYVQSACLFASHLFDWNSSLYVAIITDNNCIHVALMASSLSEVNSLPFVSNNKRPLGVVSTAFEGVRERTDWIHFIIFYRILL